MNAVNPTPNRDYRLDVHRETLWVWFVWQKDIPNGIVPREEWMARVIRLVMDLRFMSGREVPQ